MADSYATIEHLYRHGVPRGAFCAPAQLVASVDVASNVLELDGHGFSDGTPLLFRAEDGGALPAPLVAATVYFARRLSDATFQVAETEEGGDVVNLTTTGEAVLVAASLTPSIEAVLEVHSRLLDSYIPAHAVPLEAPYPPLATFIVAKLAAPEVLAIIGRSSELVSASAERMRSEMGRLARGIPIRDARAPSTDNLATAEEAVDVRGWHADGCIP